MKLIKLVGNEVKPVKAEPYENTDTGLKHFNIIIGSNNNYKRKHIKLDSRIFGNPVINRGFELLDNDYIMVPIGNKSDFNYMLSKDNSDIHKNDVLLIWELPNLNQSDTTIDIKGKYDILLKTSYVKKRRNDIKYSSPIYVIELMSDCLLSYTIENKTIKLKFNHKTSEFIEM